MKSRGEAGGEGIRNGKCPPLGDEGAYIGPDGFPKVGIASRASEKSEFAKVLKLMGDRGWWFAPGDKTGAADGDETGTAEEGE